MPEDRKTEGLLLPMSVRDNLTLPILPPHRPRSASCGRPAERRLAAGHDRAAGGPHARRRGQPVGTLSGGNQQKVLLGRWLLADPQILLLYDVTRGVDVATKHEIYELIIELAARATRSCSTPATPRRWPTCATGCWCCARARIAAELDGPGITAEDIIGAAFREETHA